MHTHPPTYADACTRTHTHWHTHIQTYKSTLTHSHAHTRTCTCRHTHTHTHSHTHAHTHTHTHTPTHTRTQCTCHAGEHRSLGANRCLPDARTQTLRTSSRYPCVVRCIRTGCVRLVLYEAHCTLHEARCMLHWARCMLHGPVACCTGPVACCMLHAARIRRHSACHVARPIGPSARLGIPSRTVSAIPRGFGIRHGAVSHAARYPLQPSVARIVLRRSTNVLQRSTTCCNNSQWLGSRPCCCPEKRKEPLQSQQRSSDGPGQGHAMLGQSLAGSCHAMPGQGSLLRSMLERSTTCCNARQARARALFCTSCWNVVQRVAT